MATAALVLGIVGICLFWVPFVGPVVALVGVVLGLVGISAGNKLPSKPLVGRAKVGLLLGIIGLAGGAAFTVWVMTEVDRTIDDFEEINTDPIDGSCNEDRFLQDPDCLGFGEEGINSDPADGSCNEDRFMQDPDCTGFDDEGMNSDPSDGSCDFDRFWTDPDC